MTPSSRRRLQQPLLHFATLFLACGVSAGCGSVAPTDHFLARWTPPHLQLPSRRHSESADTSTSSVSLVSAERELDPASEAVGPAARRIEHVSAQDFPQKVLEAEERVLVDFYADWCGPCKQLGPVLEEVARDTDGARIVKVNIDDNPDLADDFRVKSVPTLLVFDEGRVIARRVGMADKESLQELLHP